MTAAWNSGVEVSPLRSPARIVALTAGSIASSSSLQPATKPGIEDGESAATTLSSPAGRSSACSRASMPPHDWPITW